MLHWFQGAVSFNLFLPLKGRKMLAYFWANPSFLSCWLQSKNYRIPLQHKKTQKKRITLGKKRPVTSCVMLKRTHFLSPLGAEPVCKEQGKVCTCGYQKAIQVHHKPALPHTSQILWGSMYWDCHFLVPGSFLINLDGTGEVESSFFQTAPDPAAKALQS